MSMKLDGNTALLIIDMQNDFVLPGAPMCVAGALATVPAIQQLIRFAREKRWRIVYAVREHDASGCDVEGYRRKFFEGGRSGFCVTGTEGARIVEGLEPHEEDITIVKKRNSAFFKTDLDALLKSLAVKNVVICGTQYPNCVRATANDAMSYDYNVVLCTDATSAQTEEIAQANIRDLRNMGIVCVGLDVLIGGASPIVDSVAASAVPRLGRDNFIDS